MSMFKNYQDIADNYVPNNLVCSFPIGKSYTKLDPVKASKPFEEYNVKGELIGYSWYQGETLNLEFNIDGEIVVETDSIRYNLTGEEPSVSTEGYIGQRAYNIVDLRSWTCSAIDHNEYIWTEDKEFQHDLSDASESIYVSAKDYLSNKNVEFQILNFRFEPIFTKVLKGDSNIIVKIDKDISSKLVKGVYYCSLTVVTEFLRTPIFSANDCTLLVK